MSVAQSPVHWKRLLEPPAVPGWLTLGWKLVNALSNIEYLQLHLGGVWRFCTTPLGNVLLILGGFLWLAVVVFWPRKSEPIGDLQLSTAETKEQPKPTPPNTTVTTYDPVLEIKFNDLRGVTISSKPEEQACFDLINRGIQSNAKFVCIEDFHIGRYYLAFRNFPQPIGPHGQHASVSPLYVNEPDGTQSKKDIFHVFWEAWDAMKNPHQYDYSVPMRTTYQDDFRNLFEARCDLVFYPHEHLKSPQGQHSDKIIEVKNLKLRKVAPVTTRVDWIK
jgi:hypothetical protein